MFLTRVIKNTNYLWRSIATSAVTKCQSNSNQLVIVDINDKTGYATLSLNRPPANSFNLEQLVAFSKALDDIEKSKVKGMILTSNVPKIFSVGFDVREFNSSDENRLREFWTVVQDCWLKLYGSYYPTAAAITGHNPAGGCFFSMSCEYRVMVSKSKIGLSGARLGIAIPLPIILSMRSILSPHATELAITTGKLFTTEEALKIGLIDEIAEDKEDALRKCERFLDRFKKIPPNARALTKQAIRKKELDEIANNRKRDVDEFIAAVTSHEAKESFEIFLDPSKYKEN
ncbi:hypothetical protein PVAND_005494 [Polypedilum vanderplanki]|uniref:Enoyl-CoA delta isomerase 1, mitochondrial n=1 Tax=Polypedilum vanderplanki TaxID=319348 RepID=A0A9J6C0S7_POLVA|nr:hypothetical protein PVAND_005494 [Polypedilum vanderplanki]